MSSIESILSEVYERGIRLWLDGDQLRFSGPKGALHPDRLSQLRARRQEIVEFLSASSAAVDTPPLVASSGAALAPLSFSQERLWFLDQLGLVGASYNIKLLFRLSGEIDVASLRWSFEQLERRHESLRTRFVMSSTEAAQIVDPPGSFRLWYTDLTGLDASAREQQLETLVRAETERIWDLANGPLWRVSLSRLQQREHALLISIHHILCDGWSIQLLQHELSELYTARVEGRAAVLPELRVQYSDYASWQRQQWDEGRLQRQLSHWKAQLTGAPLVLDLPVDRPRPAVASFKGAVAGFAVSRELTHSLLALAQREGVTLYILMLAALQVLLFRWSAQRDIVVGSPIAGRTRRELEPLIGMFVNTLLMRTDLSGDPSFSELLARVRGAALNAYAHQELPLEKLVAELRPQRNLSHQSLFQVMLSVDSADASNSLQLAGLNVRTVRSHWSSSKVDLTVFITPTSEGLLGTIEYATDLFDAGTIERLSGHFKVLLAGIAENPERRIGAFPMLTAAERQQLLEGWNPACPTDRSNKCVHELFAEQAASTPAAVAVTYEGSSLTYGELDRRANQLAHYLLQQGAGPECLIALCMQRSLDMIVGVLGILKAGAAYVPIDPSYPADRIQYILEDSGARMVVTHGSVGDMPCIERRKICVTTQRLRIEAQPSSAPHTSVGRENLIYCIYTSGSTGQPKGALLTHENVTRLFSSTQTLFGFSGAEVWTMFHSLSFDFSVWEIFGPLLHGGRLVIVPYVTSRSPEAYLRLLHEQAVTVASLTPSAFKLLDQAARDRDAYPLLERLRYVVFGGEALNPASLASWIEALGARGPKLVNMYGITETTVHVTYREIGAQDLLSPGVSPIGLQMADLQLFALDDYMSIVPAGVAGELYVGGRGLARAYHRRPALTAQRFVPHPYPRFPGERLYRTGDLVRRRSDGQLEYLGRIDRQVKLHGFRIELGEIEAALCQHEGVAQAVAAVAEQEGKLIAWVVPAAGEKLDTRELRGWLASRLPSFMVPADVVAIDTIPLTTNGKIDRGALTGGYRPVSASTSTYCAPRTMLQADLVSIWEELLQVTPIGIHDNFFALGGDSIRAVQVVRAARERRIPLSVALLMKHQSVAALAEAVASESVQAQPLALPTPDWRIPEEVMARAQTIGAVEVYPVTAMQQLMLEQYALSSTTGEGVYHVQQAFRIEGHEPSIDAMRSALDSLIQQHSVLRTVFLRDRTGAWFQAVKASAHAVMTELDLSDLSEQRQQACIAQAIELDRANAFDVADVAAVPHRYQWFRTDETRCEFLMSIHHAIDDGWGNQHFLAELFENYHRIRSGIQLTSTPRPNVFRDFVALERDMAASESAARFWSNLDILPVRLGAPAERRARLLPCSKYRVVTPPQLLEDLLSASRRAGVALRAMIVAAYARTLQKYLKQDAVTFGVVCNGRTDRLSDPLHALGLFWNLVPVCIRARAAGEGSPEQHVQRLLNEIEPFASYPLNQIAGLRGVDELFFATLNFTNFHNRFRRDVAADMRIVPLGAHDRFHYPLNYHLAVRGRESDLAVSVEFSQSCFSEGIIRELTDLLICELRERAMRILNA